MCLSFSAKVLLMKKKWQHFRKCPLLNRKENPSASLQNLGQPNTHPERRQKCSPHLFLLEDREPRSASHNFWGRNIFLPLLEVVVFDFGLLGVVCEKELFPEAMVTEALPERKTPKCSRNLFWTAVNKSPLAPVGHSPKFCNSQPRKNIFGPSLSEIVCDLESNFSQTQLKWKVKRSPGCSDAKV